MLKFIRRSQKKVASLLTAFLLLANSLSLWQPVLLLAQGEPTPTPEPTAEAPFDLTTPTPTDGTEVNSQDSTPAPQTPLPTDQLTATESSTPIPTEPPTSPAPSASDFDNNSGQVAEPSAQLSPTPEPAPTPDSQLVIKQVCLAEGEEIKASVNEDWNINETEGTAETKNKVALGMRYVFPLENKVTVTFKCLPEDESLRTSLKIQKVKVSDLKLPDDVKPTGEWAYDITTGMENGNFEYEVTLPKPENQTAEVSYIEKSVKDATKNEIKADEVKAVEEEKLAQEGDKVKAEGLDHFTIFLTEVTEKDISQKSPSPTTLSLPSLSYNPSDDYALTSVTGVWTSVTGGSNITGLDTQEVRWGYPTGGSNKSGLRFDGTGQQSFNEGNNFLLGALTHFNYPVTDAATGAKLKITLTFSKPAVSPNPDFSYDFVIDETSNSCWLFYPNCCPYGDSTGNGCDDKITFPASYGEKSFQIGDKLYTLKIQGFVNSWPGGSPVSYFITGEKKDNTAYLVGTLSSVLVAAPQISLVEKAVNGDDADTAPGPNLYVGDTATFTYSVQNTGNVTLTSIVVKDDNGTPGNTSDDFTVCSGISLDPGKGTTCTTTKPVIAGQYTNTAYATGKYIDTTYTSTNESANYFGVSKGTIIIVKNAIPNDPQDFKFTGDLGNFDLDDDSGDSTLSNTKTFSNITPKTYTVTEPNVLGWDLTNVTCDDGNSQGNANNRNAVIQLDPGETVTCTFTNTQQKGHLIVQKTTIPAGDSTSFAINATGTGTITGGGAGTITDSTEKDYEVTPGTYSVTETVPTGWVQTSNTCTNVVVGAGENETCEITNTKYGSITIVKDSQPDSSQSFGFTTTGTGLTDFALSDDGSAWGNETKTFNNLLPGDYTVTETSGDFVSWALTDLVCPDPTNDSSVDKTNRKASINLAAGENVTCTYTNTMYGSITVQKNVDLNGDGDFSDTGETNATDWTWKLNGDTGHSTNTTVGHLLPATYTVSETHKDGYHVNNMSCRVTSGGATTIDYGAVESGNVTLGAGQTFVCTFTNTRDTGTIELKKVWSGTGGQTNLNIGTTARGSEIVTVQTGASGGDPLTTGQQTVPVGTYYLSESGGLDGYTKSSLSCFNDADNDGSQDTGESATTVGANDSVSVAAGNHIICSYTNTRQQGTIIVKKVMVGGIDTFTFSGTPSGTINTDGGTLSATVDTGSYTTTESDLTGWKLTSISCDDETSTSPSVVDLANKTATFNVENGETVTCTFTNTKYGSITIVKDTNPDDSQGFGFKAPGISNYFALDGDPNSATFPSTITFSNLLAGSYTVREYPDEDNAYGDWTLTNLRCDDPTENSFASTADPYQANINLAAGENVTCKFTNELKGKIIVQKETLPNDSTETFEFDPSWSTSNFSLSDGQSSDSGNLAPGTYSVVENSKDGWTLSSATCSDGSSPSSISLQSNETVTCTFTNKENYGSISGYKYEDINGNGSNDYESGSDPGLSGWTIELYDASGKKIRTSITDSRGEYEFLNIPSGNYQVCEVEQTGWKRTQPSDSACQDVTVSAGQNTSNINFGNQRNPARIKAYKVICDSEQYLPNWGNHGATTINDTTAQNFVANSGGHCQLATDWKFQYGGTGSFGSFQTDTDEKATPWQTFNVNSDAVINDLSGYGSKIEVREVFPNDTYIGFSNDTGGVTNPQSAEFYCSGDVYNYDNWEWINNPQYGQTYYCVGFNAPKNTQITGQKFNDSNGDGTKDGSETGLAGWTIYAAKEVDSLTVNSKDTPTVSSIALESGQYLIRASGTYDANDSITADAKYSHRAPNTIWTDVVQHYESYGPKLLDLQINGDSPNWGSYNPNHIYWLTYIGAGSAIDFEIYDLNNGDNNSGQLNVGIYKVLNETTTDSDGNYNFNLSGSLTGNLIVAEQTQTGWAQTAPNTGYCSVTPYTQNSCDFGNRLAPDKGTITVDKVTTPAGEEQKFNFDIKQAGVSKDSFSLADLDSVHESELVSGIYSIFETLPAGWIQESVICKRGEASVNPNNIVLAPEDLVECTFTNIKLGSISGYKYEDKNGDGEQDSDENNLLSGWTINLKNESGSDPIASTTTDASGNYQFSNVLPGNYQVCEVEQGGWIRTYPLDSNCQTVTVPAGQEITNINFGNQEVILGLTLVKSNNAAIPSSVGSVISYSLKITNTGNQKLTGVTIIDSPAGGFGYVGGSGKLDDGGVVTLTLDGGYLNWYLGDLAAGQKMILTYDLLTNSDLISGIYPNLAIASGVYNTESSDLVGMSGRHSLVVEAIAQVQEDNGEGEKVESNEGVPVNSQVELQKSLAYSTGVGGTTGAVLGAATVAGAVLPAAGADTKFLLLAILALALGVLLKLGGLGLEKNWISGRGIKKYLKKLLVWIFFLALFSLPFSSVKAFADYVSISKLNTYTNKENFKLSYSALSESAVTAQFYIQKDGDSSWRLLGSPLSAPSGQVEVKSDDFYAGDAKYFFKVIINSNEAVSDQTSTILDRQSPDAVRDYRKERGDGYYRLLWRNPTSEDFDRVIIYRSKNTNFTADSSTEVGTIRGSRDSEMTSEYSATPDEEYYFALRVIDKAGNASGIVADPETQVTAGAVLGATTTTQASSQAAKTEVVKLLPKEKLDEGKILGAEASATPEATLAPASPTPATGVVGKINSFAAKTPQPFRWILTHKKISLGILVVLAAAGYGIYRAKQAKKRSDL